MITLFKVIIFSNLNNITLKGREMVIEQKNYITLVGISESVNWTWFIWLLVSMSKSVNSAWSCLMNECITKFHKKNDVNIRNSDKKMYNCIFILLESQLSNNLQYIKNIFHIISGNSVIILNKVNQKLNRTYAYFNQNL